uniref:THAP-type domain-containing protein n=1 Tax=Amphiprion percula TaxID=161767 RepID=A0A3P8TCI5_AMPPE
ALHQRSEQTFKLGLLRRTWIESIQREKLHVSRFSRVCSRHFTGEDFQENGRLLKPGAVPVILLYKLLTAMYHLSNISVPSDICL